MEGVWSKGTRQWRRCLDLLWQPAPLYCALTRRRRYDHYFRVTEAEIMQTQTPFLSRRHNSISSCLLRGEKKTRANKTKKKLYADHLTDVILWWAYASTTRAHIRLGICTRKRRRHEPRWVESSWMSVSEYMTIIGFKLLSSLPLSPASPLYLRMHK